MGCAIWCSVEMDSMFSGKSVQARERAVGTDWFQSRRPLRCTLRMLLIRTTEGMGATGYGAYGQSAVSRDLL